MQTKSTGFQNGGEDVIKTQDSCQSSRKQPKDVHINMLSEYQKCKKAM